MHKNCSACLNSTALGHYLNIKHLDFRHKNNSTLGILSKEINMLVAYVHACCKQCNHINMHTTCTCVYCIVDKWQCFNY